MLSMLEDDSDFIEELFDTIADTRNKEGNKLFIISKYDEALRCYSDAVKLCPKNASYLGNKSACLIMLGRYNEALGDARQSTQIDKNFEKGYVRVVKCCLALGDLVGTEQAIKNLMEISSTAETLVKREVLAIQQLLLLEEKAQEYYDKEDYRTCLYQVDTALKHAPASPKYILLKAECLAILGRLKEANDIVAPILQDDFFNADAIFVRGLIHYFKDYLEDGINGFWRALNFNPDHKHAKIWQTKAKLLKEKKDKANELLKNNKFRDALTMFNEALKVDPFNKETNSKLYYNRALVNRKLGNLIETILDCNEALLINPLYVEALRKRGSCYYDLEKFVECIADYKKALNIKWTFEIQYLLHDAEYQLRNAKRKGYYKILEIGENATADEIKKAYRKQALLHHPDKHSNATEAKRKEQEIKFKQIGAAYVALSNSVKKPRFESDQDENGSSSDQNTDMDSDDDQCWDEDYYEDDNNGGWGWF